MVKKCFGPPEIFAQGRLTWCGGEDALVNALHVQIANDFGVHLRVETALQAAAGTRISLAGALVVHLAVLAFMLNLDSGVGWALTVRILFSEMSLWKKDLQALQLTAP